MTRKTALLVVDAQIGIIEGPKIGPVHNKDEVLQSMSRLVMEARAKQIPIVYIQDLDVAAPTEQEFQVHAAIAPQTGEPVIHKTSTDAFHLTSLHETLQAHGIDHLVIIGCKTEYCVDSTCRRATTLGYDVTLVEDGHSTTDNSVLKAEQIIAHHNTNLHGLSNVDNFIIVRNSAEPVFEPSHDTYRT